MKVLRVKENYRKSYKTAYGEFFIHGVIFEGGDKTAYEFHSKQATCTLKAGADVDAELSVVKGVPRVKLKQAAFNRGGGGSAPPSKDQLWLAAFAAVCTLKSGTDAKLVDVLKATDVVIKQLEENKTT